MKKTKEHAKGVPYGKLKNWFNKVTSSPTEAAKKAFEKSKNKCKSCGGKGCSKCSKY